MRTIILLISSLLVVQACNHTGDGYTVEVELEGAEGKWIRLMRMEDREYVAFDSVKAKPGTVPVMTGSVDGVETVYLTLEDEQGSIRILMENADYLVSGTWDDPEIVSTGKAQKDLNAYIKRLKPVRDNISGLRNELQEAFAGDNEALKDSLRDEYYALYEKQEALDSAYIADNPASYATVLALRGTYYKLDTDQLETALDALAPELHQMDEYAYMKEKLERMKAVAVGQPYTDFGLETPQGDLLRVSDVHRGNVLLIDFWASWCGPCRRANPELVEIYNEYSDRGFEILGVSLDRDSASWVQAIQEDSLTWHHISDLQYWDSKGAKLYGVPAIPHTVLIDREGIIAAKKLHGDALRTRIEELL